MCKTWQRSRCTVCTLCHRKHGRVHWDHGYIGPICGSRREVKLRQQQLWHQNHPILLKALSKAKHRNKIKKGRRSVKHHHHVPHRAAAARTFCDKNRSSQSLTRQIPHSVHPRAAALPRTRDHPFHPPVVASLATMSRAVTLLCAAALLLSPAAALMLLRISH